MSSLMEFHITYASQALKLSITYLFESCYFNFILIFKNFLAQTHPVPSVSQYSQESGPCIGDLARHSINACFNYNLDILSIM